MKYKDKIKFIKCQQVGARNEARVAKLLKAWGCTDVVQYSFNSKQDCMGIDISAKFLDIPINIQVKSTPSHVTRFRRQFRHDINRKKIICLSTSIRPSKPRNGEDLRPKDESNIKAQFFNQFYDLLSYGVAW